MHHGARLRLTSALTFGTLLVHSGAAFAAPLPPQASRGDTSTSNGEQTPVVDPTGVPDGDARTDIIVVGIRGSVASAADKKKNAKQIVDSVVSEDAGKLPDNNVPEALSRVTGVQITRERGQGQEVAIRGLSGVQTTINGNNTNLGQERSINLADIPAELIKSVDVYKTRTADQVEGSIAGTVNVELRRPLDMAKGLTVAGSLRGSYDDVAKKVSPYGSLLVADRFQTGIGEIGVLFNGSLTRTNYLETYIDSESPDTVCCTDEATTSWDRLPENQRGIIVPYRAQYGLEQGRVDRPSLNAVLQWKPRDNLDFILEGGYIGSHEKRQADRLFALLRERAGTLGNIQLGPDGKIIRSVTLTQATGIPVGIDSVYNTIDNRLYTTNFETHWNSDRAQVNASVQYNWSNADEYFVEHLTRPIGLTSATVDFLSDQYKGGVPSITLNGVDLGNIASYGVDRFQDNIGQSSNKEFVSQADVTLTLSEASFLRSLQVGTRFDNRVINRNYGYRDGYPRVNGQPASLTSLPGGETATLTGPPINGAPRWYRIPGAIVLDRIGDIRSFIQRTDAKTGGQFASEFPSSDKGEIFDSTENTFALYGQVNYAFDVVFPIDGVVGVRYVNTWGTSTSNSFTDGAGGVRVLRSTGRGNFTDILPSATATLHFTPKLQLRLSYTTNVQRASFYDLRPFYFVNPTDATPTVDAGNPDLKAQREHAFDVSAEYFFGRGGQVTLAGYYKKASNFFYADRFIAPDLGAYGLPGRSGFIRQQRNAGDGTFAGLEGTAQSFFDFLPGFGRNFGVSLNASYLLKARVEYPYPEDFPGAFDSVDTSKFTGNAILFYDTPVFSTRVAFNYRSPYRLFVWPAQPEYSWYQDRTYRLDAAVNYTPVKFLTLSIEGTNLTRNDAYSYFGRQNVLPRGVRIQSRTIQASARFRF